ncbi:MAG: ribosome silencing factor [Bacteroidota bacterium]
MNSIKIKPQKSALKADALNDIIIDSIQDIKGQGLVKLDLRQLDDAPTDFFIICEAQSNVQARAITDNVQKRLKEEAGVYPSSVEGGGESRWICIDYFYTVVHIFFDGARQFYELEDLWSDAIFAEYEDL